MARIVAPLTARARHTARVVAPDALKSNAALGTVEPVAQLARRQVEQDADDVVLGPRADLRWTMGRG